VETVPFERKTHQIKDLAKVDFHAAIVEVWIVGRIVNQLTELALSHLRGTISENEK
jgi:hypothetical protein